MWGVICFRQTSTIVSPEISIRQLLLLLPLRFLPLVGLLLGLLPDLLLLRERLFILLSLCHRSLRHLPSLPSRSLTCTFRDGDCRLRHRPSSSLSWSAACFFGELLRTSWGGGGGDREGERSIFLMGGLRSEPRWGLQEGRRLWRMLSRGLSLRDRLRLGGGLKIGKEVVNSS